MAPLVFWTSAMNFFKISFASYKISYFFFHFSHSPLTLKNVHTKANKLFIIFFTLVNLSYSKHSSSSRKVFRKVWTYSLSYQIRHMIHTSMFVISLFLESHIYFHYYKQTKVTTECVSQRYSRLHLSKLAHTCAICKTLNTVACLIYNKHLMYPNLQPVVYECEQLG